MAENIVQVKGRFSYAKTPGISFVEGDSKSLSRTKQSFKNEADVNFIMKRYAKSGLLTDPARVSTRMPQFGDFSQVTDYQSMKNRMLDVRSYFDSLPAVVRKRFDNDPSNLLAFIADEKNIDEALKLGLVSHDLSKLKYVDKDGVDITQKVVDERGIFVKGKRVNLDGTPWVKPVVPSVA